MLAKLARGNLLRTLREAEQAAARLQKSPDRLLPDDRAAGRRTRAAGEVLTVIGAAASASWTKRNSLRPAPGRLARLAFRQRLRRRVAQLCGGRGREIRPRIPRAPDRRHPPAGHASVPRGESGPRPGAQRHPAASSAGGSVPGRCRASAWRRTGAGAGARHAARDPARERDGVGELFGQVEARDDALPARRSGGRPGPARHGPGASTHPWSAAECRRAARGGAWGNASTRADYTLPDCRYNSRDPWPPPPNPTRRRSRHVVERALALARAGGATAAEAGVGVSTGLSVTVRLGEVETLEYQRDRSLGVTVYAGQRKGSASTANLTAAAVEETIAKALSIASFTADDEFAGLPDADTDGAPASGPRPEPSLGDRGAGGRRAREALRGRGTRVRQAHPQFRRRLGFDPSQAQRIRQQPWLHRRLSLAPRTA